MTLFSSYRLNYALLLALLFACAVACPAWAVDKKAAEHFMQGLLFENSGKDSEALEEFKKALAIDKNALYIYRQAAKAALRSGSYSEALDWSEKLAAAEPANPDNWTLLGGINWAGRNPDAARRAYEKALALDPDNTEALFQAARMLSTLDPDKSVEYLQRLAKLKPLNAPEVYYQMALVYYKLGNFDAAIKSLRSSVELEPSYMEARYMLGQLYEARGSTAAALAVYIEAVERDSKNAIVLAHIGGLLFGAGRDAEAQVYFERARAADRGSHGANFGLAMLAEKRGDYLGVANYLRASDAYSRDPALWVRTSYYLSQSGQLEEAVANLGQAHLKWPENPEITYFYALGLDDTGKSAQALALAAELIKNNPDYRDVRLQYAVLSEKNGKQSEAERVFREMLAKNPDDAYVLNYLGYMLADKGQKLGEARGFIARAVELEPDNGAYMDSLGWAEFKLGHHAEALRWLRKAAEVLNADASIWEHLGEVFSAQGKTRNAWFCLKISQNFRQSSPLAKKTAALEKKMTAIELSAVYAEYLDARYGGYDNFSAMCKITVKAGLREFYFDGILRYKAEGGVWLDFMGPMFTPVWTLRLERAPGKDSFDISDPDFLPEPAAELRPFAESVLRLLQRYYSGGFASGAPWALSGRSLERQGERLELNDDKSGLETLSGSDEKTSLSIVSSERQGVKTVPTALLLKGALSVKVNMTQWSAVFSGRPIAVPQ